MSGYQLAWLITVLASLGLVGSIYGVFRRTRFRLTLWFCVLILLTLLLIPAPVPNYPGELAPAFLVAFFEAFLQSDGKPLVAIRLLGVGAIAGIVIASILVWVFKSWLRRPDDAAVDRRLPSRRPGPSRPAPVNRVSADSR